MNAIISIIMSVYNAEETIGYAIESIINQKFNTFELIIINDGSTDKTNNIISKFNDSRIRLIHNKHDYINSLNMGLKAANGKYIARMDADDYMHPDRLNIQWNFMENHPEIDICSTWMQTFGKSQINATSYSGYINNALEKLLRENFIIHPSVIMRTETIRRQNLLYEKYDYAEDYKFWFEAAKRNLSFYIIPLTLHYYCLTPRQQSSLYNKEQLQTTKRIKEEILDYIIHNQKSNVCKNFLSATYYAYKEGLFSLKQTIELFKYIQYKK